MHGLRGDQAGENLLAHGHGGGDPPVTRLGGAGVAGQRVGKVAQDGLF